MFMVVLSNALCVDLVVFPVRADESDVNNAVGIVDPNYQPVFVSGKVENSSAVLENACCSKVPLKGCRRIPVGAGHDLIPRQNGLACIMVFCGAFDEALECPQRDHTHVEV